MTPRARTHTRLDLKRNDEIERLNQELKKYHLALDNASDHIVITDPEGTVLYANKAVEKITGYPLREVLGKKAGSLWGKQMGAQFYKNLWKRIKTEKKIFRGEIMNKRKSGERYYVHATIAPVLNESGEIDFFVGTEFDITETKESEEKLKTYAHQLEEERERNRSLLLSISDGIVVTDMEGTVTFINGGFRRLSGVTEEQVLGKDLDGAVPLTFEDGRRVPRNERPLYIAIDAVLGKKEPVFDTDTCYVTNAETGGRIPLSIHAAPFAIRGEVRGVVAVWRDITRVIAVDKAKSEFISFASHQLRTPLTGIRLAIDMLLHEDEHHQLTPDQRKYLRLAMAGVKDMTDLIETLLNISRIQMGTLLVNLEPINLAAFIDSLLREESLAFKKRNVQIKRLYANDVPQVTIDQRLMKIILENLLSNAMKYSPRGSTILIEVAKTDQDVLIGVSDTGVGVPKDQQEKIFEKLFRVQMDNPIKGTGLGLYMAKMAVDQYGGKIWCESPSAKAFLYSKGAAKGKGSSFYVTVPLKGMNPHKRL